METDSTEALPETVTLPDEGREERGRQIAVRAGDKIRRKGPFWVVPSQSHAGLYFVDFDAEIPTCSCPDWETRQAKCKHIHAVEWTIIQSTAPDGTVTETRSVKVTYRQDWPKYNAAQTHEKELAARLLKGLCAGIQTPPQKGRGRPRLPLSDCVYAAVMKVFGTMSGRRSASDLRASAAQGLVDAAPHYNTVFKTLEDPALTPILKAMIEESALPLRAIESDFAVDGSGFSTCNYTRWFDAKYGREMKAHTWLKAHVMCGVKTNIITACEVTDGNANDSPEFIALVQSTAARFNVKEVSADKGYVSKENSAAVLATGAAVYIPFKSNSTGDGPEFWRRLFHFYSFNRAEFLSKYHKRSNVESTFWMIKSKFGAALRSKSFVAQTNELLAKCLCHNLAVLVSSIYELGINPHFNGAIAPTENQWPI